VATYPPPIVPRHSANCPKSVTFDLISFDPTLTVCVGQGGSVEIDKEMFAALWKEFFTSDDKEAAGNYLFGKLSF
jgi:hypothetical protein